MYNRAVEHLYHVWLRAAPADFDIRLGLYVILRDELQCLKRKIHYHQRNNINSNNDVIHDSNVSNVRYANSVISYNNSSGGEE